MTRRRRVRFDGSGQTGSPLRIVVVGADALTAQFNDLIFDGNQPPLRLWGTGFTSVVGITFNERQFGKNVSEGAPIPLMRSGEPVWPLPSNLTRLRRAISRTSRCRPDRWPGKRGSTTWIRRGY